MPSLSLILPYYKNPGMLAHQYATWAAYPADVKAALTIIVVDDGSPVSAASVPRPVGLPTVALYRVLVDLPWHQHGARNLGAHVADTPWLLLTDMDHVVPADTLTAVLALLPTADLKTVHTFARVDAPDLRPTRNERGELKPHVNTFLLTKAHYWAVGGYDEDCVGYGTDGYFRGRLKRASTMRHLAHLPIIRYPREVVADASTFEPGVDARTFRNRGRRTAETQRRLQAKAKRHQGPTVLAFPWERVS